MQGQFFFCFLLHFIFGSGGPAFLQPQRHSFIVLAEHNLLKGVDGYPVVVDGYPVVVSIVGAVDG